MQLLHLTVQYQRIRLAWFAHGFIGVCIYGTRCHGASLGQSILGDEQRRSLKGATSSERSPIEMGIEYMRSTRSSYLVR